MPYTSRNGRNIHYYVDGKRDGENIVFLHSLGTSLELWEEQFSVFKQDYHLVALDFAGHGQSEKQLPFTLD